MKVSSPRPQVASLNTPHAQSVVLAKVVPFGVRKMKFEILPPLPPKNVKIGTLSWRSMENCSRPNSGTVSRIQFKLGTEIDHPSGITWHDSHSSTPPGHLTHFFGKLVKGQGHNGTGCLATRRRNLHFMIEYVKNAKAYILQNWHIYSAWPNFGVRRSNI